MRAARIHSYGGLEALLTEDVAIPTISADEILVKVVASALNPLD
jgi:NADPH:quinone reductase-like Zn-dependent oxidoreductase